ncbi:hypothetical protein D3C87_89150 [compost metagenome]
MRMFSIIFVAVLSASFSAQAISGSSSGTRGGGNTAAAEFSSIASEIINDLVQKSVVDVSGFQFDTKRFQVKFMTTKVFVSSLPLTLKGKDVMAINDPAANEVTFYIKDWNKLTATQKRVLVTHELIGLSFPEVIDLNYQYSSAIVKLLGAGEGAKLAETLSCQGSEPGWEASFYKKTASFKWEGGRIRFPKAVYSQAGATSSDFLIAVNATNGSSELSGFITLVETYKGSAKAKTICSVGTGNLRYPYSIQFFLDGKSYTGCCESKSKPVEEGQD